MNGDAISDLVLAAVCGFLLLRNLRQRPGMALACAAIGFAALLGTVRFLGVAQAVGPHRFFIVIASCAGLPLLADAVAFPTGEPARTQRGAMLFLFMTSLVAIALVVALRFEFYTQLAPGLSTIVLLICALRERFLPRVAGALLLTGTFALMASGAALRPLGPAQVLHYGMSVALLLMCGFRR